MIVNILKTKNKTTIKVNRSEFENPENFKLFTELCKDLSSPYNIKLEDINIKYFFDLIIDNNIHSNYFISFGYTDENNNEIFIDKGFEK